MRLVLDKKGRSKGYGYVDMDSEEALTEAISLNGTKIENRAIKVARSKPTSKRVRPVVQAPRLPSEPVSRCVLFITSCLSLRTRAFLLLRLLYCGTHAHTVARRCSFQEIFRRGRWQRKTQ